MVRMISFSLQNLVVYCHCLYVCGCRFEGDV